MSKRDTFSELMEGIEAMRLHREGKITLRTHVFNKEPLPKIKASGIRHIREQQHVSQTIFAGLLQVSPRTFQKWEQGVAVPNEQAKLLILLTEKYPDMLQRIRAVVRAKSGSLVHARKKVKKS